MTAEIAIFNREGVAMAADSAVTVSGPSGQKVLTTANKIFALSRVHPVGIMFYGSAGFVGVPWETLIKAYREDLGERAFDTIDEYSDGLFDFIRAKQPRYFPEEAQRDHVIAVTSTYLRTIRREIDNEVDKALATSGTLTTRQIQGIVRQVVADWHDFVDAAPDTEGAPAGYQDILRRRYGSLVAEGIELLLGAHARSRATERLLREALLMVFRKHLQEDDRPEDSGVFVAGFGRDDIFPSIREYHVEGMAGDFAKLHTHLAVHVGPGGTRAGIRPLAQSEMVVRFMEGVDPDYNVLLHQMLEQIVQHIVPDFIDSRVELTAGQRSAIKRDLSPLAQTIVASAEDTLSEFRRRYFAEPVTTLVDLLPKPELAAMAESLVNLTSFKRRVSWDDETVGGPIDVAFISRGDGFVWIKRKHYFPAELNPQYFAAKYGR